VAVSFLWTLACIALILVFLGNVVWTGRKEKPSAKAKAKAGARETSFSLNVSTKSTVASSHCFFIHF